MEDKRPCVCFESLSMNGLPSLPFTLSLSKCPPPMRVLREPQHERATQSPVHPEVVEGPAAGACASRASARTGVGIDIPDIGK